MIIKIGKKRIGELVPQYRIFKKTVQLSKHLFFSTDSWGIDSGFFHETLLPNDYTISIYDKEEDITYIATAKIFKEKGDFKHFKPYGLQIMLKREFFGKLYK